MRHRLTFCVFLFHAVFAGILLSAPGEAKAHELAPAVAQLTFKNALEVNISIELNLEALISGISPTLDDTDQAQNAARYNELRALVPEGLVTEFRQFESEFLEGLNLIVDGEALAPLVREVGVAPVGDLAIARTSTLEIEAQIAAGSHEMTFAWAPAFGPIILRVDAPDGAEVFTAYLQDGAVGGPISLKGVIKQRWQEVARNFITVGFEHIVPKGLDHILFVVGLFLLSTHLRPLLWQITSFTLAHTVTLALGSLGLVSVPASIVEPLIALSIAYVCIENIFLSNLSPWRPMVVFAFGLLHGLGFAGVLSEVGLGHDHFFVGLIAFNLGVELGQLTVILGCFLAVGIWFGQKPWYRWAVTVPASAGIGIVGLFWFVERTFFA